MSRVGARIKQIRESREPRLSAEALAERVSALGYPYSRSALNNLEYGRKRSVDVAELLTLAKALGVPPGLLLFPVGATETVEALPGREVPTWNAFQWLAGQTKLEGVSIPPRPEGAEEDTSLPGTYGPDDPGGGPRVEASGVRRWYNDPEAGWEVETLPIRLYADHAKAVESWNSAHTRAVRLVSPNYLTVHGGDVELSAQDEERIAELVDQFKAAAEREVVHIRTRMQDHGIVKPSLPPALRHLDGAAPDA